MPTYEIPAPNGRTYAIEGPPGATDEQVRAEVVRQYPESQRSASGPEIRAEPESNWLNNIARSYQQGMRTLAGEALPIGGAIGGALLGTAGGAAATGPLAPIGAPAGAAIGSGLGYQAGSEANRAISALMNYFTGKPVEGPSMGNRLARTGKDFLVGAAMEAGGQVLNRFGQALGEVAADAGVPGFGAMADPAIQATRAAAARQGIELPASVATGSRPLAAIEAVPGRFPFGTSPAREFYDRTALTAQRAGERLRDSAGPQTSLEAAGRSIEGDVSRLAGAQEESAAGLRSAYEADAARRANAAGVREQGFVQGEQATAQGAINRFLGQYGEGATAGPAGELAGTRLGAEVQAALEAAQTEARGRVNPMFSAVREEASAAGSDVPMTQTRSIAQGILDLEGRLGALGRRQVVGPAQTAEGLGRREIPEAVSQLPETIQAQVIRQFGLDQPNAIPPDLAMELQKRLSAAVRSAPDDVTRRSLMQLRDAVGQDVSAWAEVAGPNVGPMRAQASQAYHEQIAPYFTEKAPLRARLMDVEPEVAGQQLLALRDSQLIQDAMHFLPPETQNRIRASVLARLPRDSAGFEAAASKFKPDALVALLGPEQAQALTALRGQLGTGRAGLATNRAFGQAIQGAEAQAQEGAHNLRMELNYGPRAQDPQLADIANKRGDVAGLVNSLTKGNPRSLEDFDAVWNTVSPETQNQVRSAALGRLLENAKDPATRVDSLERFMSRQMEVPDYIWARMLTPEQKAAMDDIVSVVAKVNEFARGSGNASNTVRGYMATQQVSALVQTALASAGAMAAATGNQDWSTFGLELAAILSPGPMGKALFSRPAQGFLTRPRSTAMTPLGAFMKTLGYDAGQIRDRGTP